VSHPSIHHNDVLLTLIGKILLISDPLGPQIQPFAAAELGFDSKFETIYEQQVC
jgi:hypothetical protein